MYAFANISIDEVNYLGTIEEWADEHSGKSWVRDSMTINCTNGIGCNKCTGGEATCQSKATCDVCGYKYGDFGTCDS